MTVIDVHHHWLPQEHVDNCERYLPSGHQASFDGRVWHICKGEVEVLALDTVKYPSIEEKLQDMDEEGVDLAVVCTSVWQQWTTLEMGRFINDELAKVCRAHPQRIAGLAHVPPMHPEAPAELERAVVELGMVGACITTNTQGKYPDDPAYYPFYAKAAELEAPVFVHAASTPVEYENLRPYDLARQFGRAVDHMLARLLRVPLGAAERDMLIAFLDTELGTSDMARAESYLEEGLRMLVHLIMSQPEYQLG